MSLHGCVGDLWMMRNTLARELTAGMSTVLSIRIQYCVGLYMCRYPLVHVLVNDSFGSINNSGTQCTGTPLHSLAVLSGSSHKLLVGRP